MTKLEDVVLIQIDCEKGEGVELAKRFNIQGYPTFVLADASAQTMARWMGYTKDQFLKKMDAGFSDLTTIEAKEIRFSKEPDLLTALTLAEYSESVGKLKKSAEYYREADRLDPDNDYAYELFQLYRWGNRKGTFTVAEVKEAGVKALASNHTDNESRFWVLHAMSGYAAEEPENEKMLGYVKDAQKLITDIPDIAADRYKMDISIWYTLLIEKDVDKAVNMKKANMPEGWMDDAGDLNAFSWWCFENRVNLAEAENLARRGIKLAEPGRQKAMIIDTCAEIVNARGNSEEAVSLIKLALKEDPDSKYYKEQLEKFKTIPAN